MDAINGIKLLLFIVLAILPIILFFKVWGMTNDIKEMKNIILKKDELRDAEIAYLNGNSHIAQHIMDECLRKIIAEEKQATSYSEVRMVRQEKVLATYEYLGLKIPEDIDLSK